MTERGIRARALCTYVRTCTVTSRDTVATGYHNLNRSLQSMAAELKGKALTGTVGINVYSHTLYHRDTVVLYHVTCTTGDAPTPCNIISVLPHTCSTGSSGPL